jgi:hypothetical protein
MEVFPDSAEHPTTRFAASQTAAHDAIATLPIMKIVWGCQRSNAPIPGSYEANAIKKNRASIALGIYDGLSQHFFLPTGVIKANHYKIA